MVPVAVPEKVAVPPTTTVALTGCEVIEGASFTVIVAALEVALPAELVATQRNCLPLSPNSVVGVV